MQTLAKTAAVAAIMSILFIGCGSDYSGPAEPNPNPNPNGVGLFTVRCSGGLDVAGNSGDEPTLVYSVDYEGDPVTGLKILQPINSDNTSMFSRGRTVPVKFKLAGDEPLGFSAAGWFIQRQSVTCSANFDPDGAILEPVPSSNPTGLRYDATSDQYIQNSDFRNAALNTCWRVRAVFDDGNTTLCMSSAVAGYKRSFGSDGPPGAYDDLEQADVAFLIGANIADNHPILCHRLECNPLRKLVVVDPRVTKTAMMAITRRLMFME